MPPSDKKMKSLYPPTARGQEQKIIQEGAQPLIQNSTPLQLSTKQQVDLNTYNNMTAPSTASSNPPPGATPATANPVDVAVSTGLVGATVGATGACVVVATRVAVFCAAQNVANEAIARQTDTHQRLSHLNHGNGIALTLKVLRRYTLRPRRTCPRIIIKLGINPPPPITAQTPRQLPQRRRLQPRGALRALPPQIRNRRAFRRRRGLRLGRHRTSASRGADTVDGGDRRQQRALGGGFLGEKGGAG